MKHLLKIHGDIIFINLIFLLLGITFYDCFDKKVEILAVFLVTGISLSVSYRQYKIQDDQIFKELFISFNSKYDKEFNDLLNDVVLNAKQPENYTLSDLECKKIVDYINFCSEEYLWFHKDRIPLNVWKAWQEGMIYFLNCKPINKIFLEECLQEGSYYGLFQHLRGKVSNWNRK